VLFPTPPLPLAVGYTDLTDVDAVNAVSVFLTGSTVCVSETGSDTGEYEGRIKAQSQDEYYSEGGEHGLTVMGISRLTVTIAGRVNSTSRFSVMCPTPSWAEFVDTDALVTHRVPYGLYRPLMPHDETGVELTVRFGVPYDELERRAGPDLSPG